MLPEVPTIAEAGVKGYDMGYWFAAYAPAGTPTAVVNRLNQLLVNAVKSEAAQSFFEASGSVAWTTSPAELARFQVAETEKWGRVIKAAGITAE
jgi:tripartite-type tricarboxylate transporter receptor subunit TctC